jgi:hypothetical protein
MKKLNFVAAAVLALSAIGAQATTLTPVVTGATFTDLSIGTIVVSSTSDLLGHLFAADNVTGTFMGSPYSLTLQAVTFSSSTVGTLGSDLDASAAGFSFKNVAAGSYEVKASGFLSGSAQILGTGFVGADYTVTAVPEPETYALMLAGLAAVGFVARRRKAA